MIGILTVGSRVIFSPPFPRCRYTWGTIVELNLAVKMRYRREGRHLRGTLELASPHDCYLVKLPSGLVLSVRRNRCEIPDAVTKLGLLLS